jgi:heme exporter protein B
MIPALMAAIQISTGLINGQSLAGAMIDWLKLLAGFDLIYTALALALADTVLVG